MMFNTFYLFKNIYASDNTSLILKKKNHLSLHERHLTSCIYEANGLTNELLNATFRVEILTLINDFNLEHM